MEKIIFKGIRKDNKEWVEGYLLQKNCPERYYIGKYSSSQVSRECKDEILSVYKEIDYKTICRYTGLNDSNYNHMFEHDVFRFQGEDNEIEIFFRDGSYGYYAVSIIEHTPCRHTYFIPFAQLSDIESALRSLTIIGNIYDPGRELTGCPLPREKKNEGQNT